MGAGFDTGIASDHTSGNAGVSQGKMDSNYKSVTDQAGIYAGKDGFDINVKGNTDIKGSVIDSNAPAEKNQLTTGTLTWEDQQNKANYKTSGAGVSYAGKDAPLNAKGLTPSIEPTVKDNADSTTKSAVAEGTVTITNTKDQKQNVSDLNRDTKNTLNKLHEIFDKDKVQEKQEFIGLLTKDVNEAIHKVAEKNNWADGSKEKTALHALASGILAEMSGAGFNSGALAGGVNEYVIGYLTKAKGEAWMTEHPDEVQWLSAIIGGAVNHAIGGDVSTGAGSSIAETKWNYFGMSDVNIDWLMNDLELEDGEILDKQTALQLKNALIALEGRKYTSEAESEHLEFEERSPSDEMRGVMKSFNCTDTSINHFLGTYFLWIGERMQKEGDTKIYKDTAGRAWNGIDATASSLENASDDVKVKGVAKGIGKIGDAYSVLTSTYPVEEGIGIGIGNSVGALAGVSIIYGFGIVGMNNWYIRAGSGAAAWGTSEFIQDEHRQNLEAYHGSDKEERMNKLWEEARKQVEKNELNDN